MNYNNADEMEFLVRFTIEQDHADGTEEIGVEYHVHSDNLYVAIAMGTQRLVELTHGYLHIVHVEVRNLTMEEKYLSGRAIYYPDASTDHETVAQELRDIVRDRIVPSCPLCGDSKIQIGPGMWRCYTPGCTNPHEHAGLDCQDN